MEVLLLGLRPGIGSKDPKEVFRAFEALFIERLLLAMDRTVERSGFLGGGLQSELYRNLLYQALAHELSRAGGLGLAERFYRELQSKGILKDAEGNTGGEK